MIDQRSANRRLEQRVAQLEEDLREKNRLLRNAFPNAIEAPVVDISNEDGEPSGEEDGEPSGGKRRRLANE